MINNTLNVILEQSHSKWCAYTPEDIGVVVSSGSTREETIENFRLALKSHIELMRQEGMSVPTIDHLNIQELVAA